MNPLIPFSLVWLLFFVMCSNHGEAQIRSPQTPQFKQFQPVTLQNPNINHTPSPHSRHAPHSRGTEAIIEENRKRQQEIIRKTQEQSRQTAPKRQGLEGLPTDVLADIREMQQAVQQRKKKRLPTQEELSNYARSAIEIAEMLEGKQSANTKKAVWLAETNFLDHQYPFEDFDAKIKSIVHFCVQYAKENTLNWQHHDVRADVLVKYFSKTLTLRDGSTHKPFMYDFNDPLGNDSYANQTVYKLLMTNKGQCHSMPLLFRLLAEEMDVRANIALSPGHTYIKIFLENGQQPVFETTNNHLTKEEWIRASSIIPFNALRSGIYMDTLSQSELLVHCLVHLCNEYSTKFNEYDFPIDVARVGLQYAKNYPLIWAQFSAALTYKVLESAADLGHPPIEELGNYPELQKSVEMMHQLYQHMDNIGYKNLDSKEYMQWIENNQEAIKRYQIQNF